MNADPLRVLFVTGMYPAPWHETHGSFIHESARSLSRLGVDVEVIRTVAWRPPIGAESARRVPRERVLDGIRVGYVIVPHPPWPALACLQGPLRRPGVGRAIRRAQADRAFHLIHAHEVIPTGYAALPIARRIGLPLVCTAHGSDIYRLATKMICHRQAAQVVAASDQLIAVSRDLAACASRCTPPRREVAVVPNGVDLKLFRPIPAEQAAAGLGSGGDRRVLYVGNLVAHKGVLDLLEAFASVAREEPRAELIYVGGGPLGRTISERAARRGISGRVRLLGARPRAEIPLWLASSAVFVLPSHSESFGVAALEAMACARPVVASCVGGLPELIQDGTTGRLVPARNPAALATAIVELLTDPGQAARLGEAARQWVLETGLTWSDHAKRLERIYRQVLAA